MKGKKPRQVIDQDVQRRVGEIIRLPTWYSKTTKLYGDRADFSHPPKRSMPVGKEQELLNLFSGAKHRLEIATKQASIVNQYDRQLEQGKELSHLSTKLPWRRAYHGRWVYPCDCSCSSRVILTAEEIIERDDMGMGCGRRGCSSPPIDRQIWYRPRVALLLQVVQMKVLFPHLLGNYAAVLDPGKVVDSLYAKEEILRKIKNGEWWISRVAESEEVIQDSVDLKDTPDKDLFPEGQVHVLLGSWPVSLNELCELYELDFDTALTKRLLLDDEQLIDELLGEQYD